MKKQSMYDQNYHTNRCLVSTVIALVIFTLLFVVYRNLTKNVYAILFTYNSMMVLSIISWVLGLVFSYGIYKKGWRILEYALFSFALSVCFYFLHGVNFPTAKDSIWLAVLVTLIFWVLSFLYHTFYYNKKMSKKSEYVLIIIFATVSLAIILSSIIYLSRLPGFSLWV